MKRPSIYLISQVSHVPQRVSRRSTHLADMKPFTADYINVLFVVCQLLQVYTFTRSFAEARRTLRWRTTLLRVVAGRSTESRDTQKDESDVLRLNLRAFA